MLRSVEETASSLGADSRAYTNLVEPFVRNASGLFRDVLGPLQAPRHPLTVLRFGLHAIRSAAGLASRFRTVEARALIAGLAAHSVLPLEKSPSAAISLMLGIAGHAAGWPFPRGASQRLTDALVSYFKSLGGEIRTGWKITNLDDLPPARAVLMDLAPPHIEAIAAGHLPDHYRRELLRYRFGPGVFKIDWALYGPVPWQAESCRSAGTVHVGGSFEEVAEAERAAWKNELTSRPIVLVAQPSLFDATRAPAGHHTLWGYCHVPNASTHDMTHAIEAQIERFAPGFRDLILARHVMNPSAMAAHNPNLIGGDITGGANLWRQLFTRPAVRWDPYSTPNPRLFICSASTPPGGGVHGMCGYHAARSVLRRCFGRGQPKRETR